MFTPPLLLLFLLFSYMLPFYWDFSKSLHRLYNTACALPARTWSWPPRKQENPYILDNRHGQEVKLVWCEELWMQTHSTRCQDLTPRPGRSARNSEAGGAPVNIYSIWRDRVKGYHGSDYSNSRSVWADEREARVFERGGRSRQTARQSDKNSDGLSGRAAFHYRWYWVGINAPSRNTQMNLPDYS